ncbi:MAG: ParB/RepB/Spo0J family partition protein [Jatrophihabitantaceae bacterium]
MTTTRTTRTRTGDTTAPAGAGGIGAQPEPATQPAAQTSTTAPASLEGRTELLHLNPRTLIIEGNIRTKAELNPEFVESVRELGVIVPIVAVLTEQGVQVRYGQRRTLAAIETHRPTVPVMVVSGEPGAELDRIIEQWHENEHRTGLSVADQAAAAQQLTAFGLNAEDISRRLRTSKPRIAQALQVGASELATKAADRYDLTLDQAAVLAEFDQDKEALTVLIAAAKEGPGRFAHAAQAARDARERAEQIAAATAKLEKAKVRIITRDQASGAAPLNDLTASQDRKPITPAQHKKCPGHAAYVTEYWRGVETVYVCTDWRANGHHKRYGQWQDTPSPAQMSAEEADALTEQERQKRRTVIANNKAWASAETVRREWVRSVLTSKTIKGAAGFVATELALGDYALRKAMESTGLLPELLGCKSRPDLAASIEKATDSRAQVIALGVILAALEANLTREAWRTPQPAHKRYLQFLASIGYELSDVEQLVISPKKPPRKRSSRPAKPAEQDTPDSGDQAATSPAADEQEPPADASDAAGVQPVTEGGVAA